MSLPKPPLRAMSSDYTGIVSESLDANSVSMRFAAHLPSAKGGEPETMCLMLLPDQTQSTTDAMKSTASESASTDIAAMREREETMMHLLNCTSPDRLIHDLRNVMNELTLLRAVLENDKH